MFSSISFSGLRAQHDFIVSAAVPKVLKIDHIRQKADFLLQNMAFFFIPAGVGILEQFEFVKDSMWQLLLICLVTTLLTFGVTAAAVRFGVWLQKKLTGKEDS